MKPLGLTMDFMVTSPTRAQDAIWDAAEEAISEGMTPEQFRAEAAEAWSHILRKHADTAHKTLTA